VNVDNFVDGADLLEASLKDAAFVAFDLEMTGISLPDPKPHEKFYRADTPQQRYEKMCAVASHYSIIQVGVTTFTAKGPKDAAATEYEAKPFNFYVFPPPNVRRDIVLSASSTHFLKGNNMDFQQWISKGVPFVDREKEERMRFKLEGALVDKAGSPNSAPPAKRKRINLDRDDDIKFVKECMEGLSGFVKDAADGDEYAMLDCNSYLRRVLHQELDDVLDEDNYCRQTRKNEHGNAQLFVVKENAEQRTARLAEEEAKRCADFEFKLGFRRVFNALANAKKPVVGHNCLYDVMFVMYNFDGAFPETVSEFFTRVHALFPTLVDTKYVSTFKLDDQGKQALQNTVRFNSTALGDLYKSVLTESPAVAIAGGDTFARYSTTEEGKAQLHEAGWDSFVTGACLLKLADMLFKDSTGTALERAIEATKNMCYGMFTHIVWSLDPDVGHFVSPWTEGGGAVLFIVDGMTKDDGEKAVYGLLPKRRQFAKIQWSDDQRCLLTIKPGVAETLDPKALLAEVENLGHLRLETWPDYITRVQVEATSARIKSKLQDIQGSSSPASTAAPGIFSWLGDVVSNITGQKRKRASD